MPYNNHMGKVKEFCIRGHKMEESRKFTPQGAPYCYKCKAAYVKDYLKKNPGQAKETSWKAKLKKEFNLTPQEYTDLYINQNGKCTICLINIEYRGMNTHVDHCHKSGAVRSILCSNCNTAIGLLKENIDSMYRAIKYVQEHNGNAI